MKAHVLLAACAAALALAAAPALAGTTILKNQREQVEALEKGPAAKVPAGKAVASYRAPNGATTLLVRDEGEVGDFVWHALYVKAGAKFQHLGTCQQVKKVAWSKDSRTLTFVLEKATGPGTMTAFAARYKVGERKIALKPLTETAVESSM